MADAIASTRSTPASICSSRPAPEPGSRSATSRRRCPAGPQPGERIVVATATLALQSQLANNDIPAALDAVEAVVGERPRHAILKGRTNYACLLKVRDGSAQDQAGADLRPRPGRDHQGRAAGHAGVGAGRRGAGAARVGRGAGRRRRSGRPRRRPVAHRPGLAAGVDPGPGVPRPRSAARTVTPASSRQSRDVARAADLVVTNHALLAIDAMHGGTALPEHQAVVIDEAHELVGPGDRSGVGRAHPGADRTGGPAGADLAGRRGRPGPAATRPTRSATGWTRRRWSGSRTRTVPSSRPARPSATPPGRRSAR